MLDRKTVRDLVSDHLEPFLTAAALLVLTALAAAYVPARRALSIEPMTALRSEWAASPSPRQSGQDTNTAPTPIERR